MHEFTQQKFLLQLVIIGSSLSQEKQILAGSINTMGHPQLSWVNCFSVSPPSLRHLFFISNLNLPIFSLKRFPVITGPGNRYLSIALIHPLDICLSVCLVYSSIGCSSPFCLHTANLKVECVWILTICTYCTCLSIAEFLNFKSLFLVNTSSRFL